MSEYVRNVGVELRVSIDKKGTGDGTERRLTGRELGIGFGRDLLPTLLWERSRLVY
jgi:hypothetical protein